MEHVDRKDGGRIAGDHDDDIVLPISIVRGADPIIAGEGIESNTPIAAPGRELGSSDLIASPDDVIIFPDDPIIIPRPADAAGDPSVAGIGAELIEGNDDWARFRIDIGDLRRWTSDDDVEFAIPIEREENALRIGDDDEGDDPIIIPERPLEEDDHRLARVSVESLQTPDVWARFDLDIGALERVAEGRNDVIVRLELADE